MEKKGRIELVIEQLEERIAPGKCNSGGGNGNEGTPDCDPGNSGAHNNAGD